MKTNKYFNMFLIILILFGMIINLPLVRANEETDQSITESENNNETNTPNEGEENNTNPEPSTKPEEEEKEEVPTSYIEYTGKCTAQDGLNVRETPLSTSKIIAGLNYNETFRYRDIDIKKTENDTCNEWIYISTKGGYVCKEYTELVSQKELKVENDNEFTRMTDEEFDKYLTEQGFSETYKTKLKEIHKKYPNWVFKGIKTNRDWNSTVNEESEIGNSTYYMNALRESAGHEAYLNTESHYSWETNMFTGFDGYFFLANKPTVAYFLDPRNYLNEKNIFMFENLYYDNSYQSKDKITSILGTSEYNDYIFDAGVEYNYSPIAAAIKIRQEGTLNNRPTSGIKEITCKGTYNPYYDKNGQKFLGPLYNFFNIGATSSPRDADLNGLCYAAITNSKYFLPWNTKEKAIKGGIKWISANYVGVGQYTNYFQKFNTANPNTDIGHQYMTNLEDPKSQSKIVYNLYSSYKLLDTAFAFYIPIYDNMPEVTELPKAGNPNNWLTDLSVKINDTNTKVSNFSGNVTEYTVNVANNVDSIIINATTVAKTSYVAINKGDKVLKTTSKQVALEEKESSFEIVVTASNGDIKTYTLKVIKDDAPEEQPSVDEIMEQSSFTINDKYISGITFGMGSATMTEQLLEINKFATIQITNKNNEVKTTGALGTGDKLTITSKEETKSFEIILYGDVNGDGDIAGLDLLRLQRYLWDETTLDKIYLMAADVNKDGTVTGLDLLRIQRHLWKETVISQN